MTTINIETVVYCFDCGEDLSASSGKVLIEGDVLMPCIRVSPCQRCMTAAKEEGVEEEV